VRQLIVRLEGPGASGDLTLATLAEDVRHEVIVALLEITVDRLRVLGVHGMLEQARTAAREARERGGG
jgi:hypothetical protein